MLGSNKGCVPLGDLEIGFVGSFDAHDPNRSWITVLIQITPQRNAPLVNEKPGVFYPDGLDTDQVGRAARWLWTHRIWFVRVLDFHSQTMIDYDKRKPF